MKGEMDDRDGEIQALRGRLVRLEEENARLRSAQGVPRHAGEAGGPIHTDSSRAAVGLLAQAAAYAVISTDLQGQVTAWSEGARLLFGWHEGEALGQDGRMIFTPEDRRARTPEREMEEALARGRAEDERWHCRKDGSRFWASGLNMVVRDADGAAQGFLKVLRDRTEDLHAAGSQLRRLQQMKALAEAAQAIMAAPNLGETLQAITDAARLIVGAREATCRLADGSDGSPPLTAQSREEGSAAGAGTSRGPDLLGLSALLSDGRRTVRLSQAEIERLAQRAGAAEPGQLPVGGWLAAALVGATAAIWAPST
jgi:PAS domain S-box-containing protein